MYKLRSFWKKLKRGVKWGYFMYSLPPWNEYDNFLNVINRYLLEMATEFENNPITMSSEQDARDMRKVILLLERYKTEYYGTKYYKEGIIHSDEVFESTWKDTYNWEGWKKAMEMDDKALKLAFKIMGEKLPGWWQ